MDVTPTIRRADERAATAVPAAKEYRSAFPQVPVTIAAGGTGQGSGWHASSVERPSTRVAIIDCWPSPTPGVWEQAWGAQLMSHCRGSAGIVSVSCEYGPLLLHVGSSPLIVDRRSVQRPPRTDARLSADGFELLPVVDQLKELRAALSLNKSQLARIMRVTRPTIYEWYQGKDPNASNSARIRTSVTRSRAQCRFWRDAAQRALHPTIDGTRRAVAPRLAQRAPSRSGARRERAQAGARSWRRGIPQAGEP